MLSPTPKKEFLQLCEDIKKEGLAKISIYADKAFGANNSNASAYVLHDENPAHIILRKRKRYNYKYMILLLLHEYGHVMDLRKYKNSKRWKLFNKYDYDDTELEKASTYPNFAKRAILQSEFFAEKMIDRLLRKFNITVITEEERITELNITIKVRKWELLFGKSPTVKQRDRWRWACEENLQEIDLKYVNNLSVI